MARKARLDKAVIVEAAAELVNREGPAALSLSRLAERVGIQTPSLYNHVAGLPGLQRELALLNARTLADRFAEAAIGKAGADALRAIADAYRAYIKAAPGVYLASLRASGTQATPDAELGRAEERTLQVGLTVMTSFGLAGADAIHALRALRSVVHGFATLEIASGFGLPLECDESFHRLIALLIDGLQQSNKKPHADFVD
jgi:AcrR family transcriptional regulator